MAVEAKSLSSLIALADDPPSHLSRSEDHVHHDTLVLYIARVPGSRGLLLFCSLGIKTNMNS